MFKKSFKILLELNWKIHQIVLKKIDFVATINVHI